MKTRHAILGAMWINCLVVSATAETTVIRPGPCDNIRPGYLLAMNSGAVIRETRVDDETNATHVIVFRPQPVTGWASQRILRRFDLAIEETKGAQVVNSGGFCSE
ncbi:MAG: hypothetical protein HKN14_16055 [Marinicaulis sp.]|nr:hypothetical protein [Marinicaulis sp.]NNE42422.1 hypothetical protein [Marinicaulis sp.]NNL90528.1 hypothetical protein [Marinicaulis sp.]